MSLEKLAMIALLSVLPGFEGRYAAAIAILTVGFEGVVLAWLVSTLVGVLVYLAADKLVGFACNSRLGFACRFVSRLVSRHRVASVLGLIAYVAVPLPASGVWSGALIARFMGLHFHEAVAALSLGNAAAVLIVVLASLGVLQLF